MWWVKDILIDCVLCVGSVYGFILVANLLMP